MTRRPQFLKIAGADAQILDPSDPFHVVCGVRGCSSNCCTKSAPIVLNPYEIALLCAQAGFSYEEFLNIVETERVNAFPLVLLPRDPACRFWTVRGCRVYDARPLACRLFPLGRVFENGQSHLVRPSINVCGRAVPSTDRTVADYLASQDTERQILMADKWIEFVNDIERLELQDAPVTSIAFHMLVYSPDTPPAAGTVDAGLSLEDRFILRLKTAKQQLPRFLLPQKRRP